MALSNAAHREVVWLRELTNDLKDGVLNLPIIVFEATIKMAKNPQYHMEEPNVLFQSKLIPFCRWLIVKSS